MCLGDPPEALTFTQTPADTVGGLRATARIGAIQLLGSILRYELEVQGRLLKLDALNRPDAVPLTVGMTVTIGVAGQNIRELRR